MYGAIGNGITSSSITPPLRAKQLIKNIKVPECPIVESRNWLINMHYVRNEFDICKIFIHEELEKSCGMNEYANYVLGVILRHEGKIQESLEYFQKCHSLNPGNSDNIKQVARSLFLLGRHTLAMEAYLEAESASTSPDWVIYHNLGLCLLQLGMLTKAKEYLLQAIQISRQEDSYIALAKIHLLENDIEGAIWVYKAALEYYGENCEMATALGLLYTKMGQFQLAFEKFGSALAHDPNNPKALLAAGAIMQGHRDIDVALSKYKIVAQYLPESSALWNNMGMCFYEKKKYVVAISCLKKASYFAPFNYKTLFNLGLVHLATQQLASAFHFLSAAINFRTNCASAFHLLAICLKKLGDPDNALQAFQEATRLDPANVHTRLNFAVFMHSLGQTKSALEQLNKFHEIAVGVEDLEKETRQLASTLRSTLAIQASNDVEDPNLENEQCISSESAEAGAMQSPSEQTKDIKNVTEEYEDDLV
ncbi:Bardet-Biedl syndrome 4 protein isoform X2 [Bacillus rossius redtenbacheri]|uniref:Bardet-Biedl syndrome 4 protein isoform X2 n=1 Tax=Bacillus rossius redtenbacheri TaxID=93214 RepID=UPI002FDDAE5D